MTTPNHERAAVAAPADQTIPPIPADPKGPLDQSPVLLAGAVEGVALAVLGFLAHKNVIHQDDIGFVMAVVSAVVVLVSLLVRSKVWAPTTVKRTVAAHRAAAADSAVAGDTGRVRAAEEQARLAQDAADRRVEEERSKVEEERQRLEMAAQAEIEDFRERAIAKLAEGERLAAAKIAEAEQRSDGRHAPPTPPAKPSRPSAVAATDRGFVVGTIVSVDTDSPALPGVVGTVIDIGEPERNDRQVTDLLVRPLNNPYDEWVDSSYVDLWPPVVTVVDKTGRAGRGFLPGGP